MKVYAGRWSEIEMNGSGIEELPPLRMVAAESAELAIQILGCSSRWFSSWFKMVEEEETTALALSRPGTVFESYVELEPSDVGFDRKVHWVPLDEMPAFHKAMWEKTQTRVQQSADSRRSGASYNPFAIGDPDILAQRIVDMMPKSA